MVVVSFSSGWVISFRLRVERAWMRTFPVGLIMNDSVLLLHLHPHMVLRAVRRAADLAPDYYVHGPTPAWRYSTHDNA
jgi:hypothetical protein